MQYYRDQVTQKSWDLLQTLARRYRFTLIGGWAVWLYTHQLKSKDIDIIVEFDELEKLRTDYNLFKNDRLKKYEIAQEEVQVDIYVPHYSRLGIPTEDVLSRTQRIEGFYLPAVEDLLTLKYVAYAGRVGTAKGRKDLVDMIGLLQLPQLDWSKVPPHVLDLAFSQTVIPELNLNTHKFSQLKKQWKLNVVSTSA